jgi:hypothetical protein
MCQIADTFTAPEGLSEKEPQDLFWEQKRLSATELFIALRRQFSDPDYPQKFDVAFRRLTGQLDSKRFTRQGAIFAEFRGIRGYEAPRDL